MAEKSAVARQVPNKEKFAFCSGDIFCGGNQAIISVVYLVFLTDVVGINAGVAGTIIMLSKIWDAITDPMMGIISDNARTKWGRRRPFVFLGGLLIIPAMAMMWLPVNSFSEVGKAIWVAFSYLLYYTVSTCVTVPYSALSTEISTDVDERSKINLTRLLFSLTSTAICTLVPSLLFTQVSKGNLSPFLFYLIVFLGFGAFYTLPVLLTAIFSHERAPLPKEKAHFSFANFVKPFKIKAFRRLLILYLAQSVTMDIVSSVVIYYAKYVQTSLSSTIFLAIFLGIQIVMFPVLNKLVTKFSKTRIYGTLLPLAILGAAGIAFYPASWNVIGLYAITALTALGFAGAETMPWIIFPDVADIGRLGLGERITGSFSGAMTFTRKVSSALAASIIGWVLALTGYIAPTSADPSPTQPADTLLGIRLIICLSFALLMGVAFIVSLRFKLDGRISKQVKAINEKEEKGEALTEEEVQQKEAILVSMVGGKHDHT